MYSGGFVEAFAAAADEAEEDDDDWADALAKALTTLVSKVWRSSADRRASNACMFTVATVVTVVVTGRDGVRSSGGETKVICEREKTRVSGRKKTHMRISFARSLSIGRHSQTHAVAVAVTQPGVRRRRRVLLQPRATDDSDHLSALVVEASSKRRDEREIHALVDAYCAEHGATIEMLTALKQLEERLGEGSADAIDAIDAVAARLTSHLLGVLTGVAAGDTSLVVQETRERLVKDLALTSELEALMIARKAESVLQLIGRKAISPNDLHVRIPDQSAAVRILDVLLQAEDATARRMMLADAFDAGEDGQDEFSQDEEREGLWTTPMVLYQAIEQRLGAARGSEAEVLVDLKAAIVEDFLHLE